MNRVVSFLLLLSLMLAQIAIYHRHRRGRRASWSRPRYPISLPTRLFRWAKGPLYGVIALHLVLDVLLARSAPAPGALGAAVGIALAALGLLHWSLRSLGPNFAPCDRGLLPREVVRAGPYHWMAHPIYTANLLLVAALIVARAGPLVVGAGVTLAAFYAFAIHDESRALRGLDGAAEGAP